MASSNLEIVIKAKDEASQAFKDISANAKDIGIGLTAVGGAITGAFAYAIKSASEAQVQMSKVYATLDAMGKDTPMVRDAIQKVADSTLALGFDNEEASVSIAKFYQRTKDLTEATKLNNVAMDLARAKNIDLTTASTLVGQALAGNGRVLKQYGIDIKDSATPLEALGVLQDKVKGQAKAFSETFAGQSEVMKQNFGELTEQIGDVFLPILTRLFQQLQPVLVAIKTWTEEHPELTKGIVLLVASVGALSLAVGTLTLAYVAFMAVAWPVVGIVALIVAGIAGLVFIGYELYKNWGLIKDTAISVWGGISAFFQQVGSEISSAWSATWNFVSEVLTTTLALLVGSIITWLNFLFPNWQAVLQGMLQIAQTIFGTIGSFFQTILNGISSAISAVAKVITPIWQALWGGVKSYFTDIWNGITGAIKSAVDFVAEQIDRLSKLIAPVSKTASSIGSAIVSGFNSVVNTGKKALGVNDAIISPNGNVITTHPDDYLIATKNPYALAGGGGVTINITGNTLLSESVAVEMGDMIIDAFKRNNRL